MWITIVKCGKPTLTSEVAKHQLGVANISGLSESPNEDLQRKVCSNYFHDIMSN